MDVSAIEKELCAYVAKTIKTNTGKGPIKTEAVFGDNCIIIKLTGYVLPSETELAQTEQGYIDVKLNRMKWVQPKINLYKETLSKIIGKEVKEFFYDFNPLSNHGVIVIYY